MTAPQPFHPARVVPADTPDGQGPTGEGELVVDPDTVVDLFQLRPDTRAAVASWAGPTEQLVSGGLLLLHGDTIIGRAELGDWVRRDPDRAVEPADGFTLRWVAATRD